MRAVFLGLFLTLSACSRPMTLGERAFADDLMGETLDPAPVRIVADVPLGVATFQYEKRPRLACRERLFPEPDDSVITTSPAGLVLWNRLLTSKGWYLDDYMAAYPRRMHMGAALFLAHELVHVWQWQNRDITGYSPVRAAREHRVAEDPYQFALTSSADFLEYGYEQQSSVVEEYLCCSILDPAAPRTARLKALLDPYFPVDSLPRPEAVTLPWEDAELRGICQ
ncbi:hypothetical protein [Thiosulfatihalobacter marinus]|uniref:hypothetical protein n=1 Tax=Thiosulfatihalobacter marinus TaxID=2792481 RepID=UPI0018D87816|nr:hypothetical protein [Thiosulfatihalobacter marinus]